MDSNEAQQYLEQISKEEIKSRVVAYAVSKIASKFWGGITSRLVALAFEKIVWPALEDLQLDLKYFARKEKWRELVLKFSVTTDNEFDQNFDNMVRRKNV